MRPDHVLDSADLVVAALTPRAGADWSVRAGPLEWDVEQTVAHLLGAVSKYTLCLASRSTTFLAVRVGMFPDATHQELLASIRPTAEGLVNVAAATPPGTRGYHVEGPKDAEGFFAMACLEMLVHADDALRGLGSRLRPPRELARAVLRGQYPDPEEGDDPWRALVVATGRQQPED